MVRPLIEEDPRGPVRHWLRAADGVRLHLLEWRRGGPQACLLLPGFNRRAETLTHMNMAHRLAGRAAMYSLDFRGHGRSEGRYAFGLAEDADVEAALDFLRSKGYRQLFLVGLSMGAYLAIRVLGARPEAFPEVRALVAVSAPSAWARVFPRMDPRIPFLVRVPPRELAWRPRYRRRALFGSRLEAEEVVGRLPCPLQVHHHRADWLIRFRHGLELYRAAREPKEFHEYGGDGRLDHADELVRRRFGEIMGRIEDFLGLHGLSKD